MDTSNLIKEEVKYQQEQLKLIPSENYVSPAVMQAVGSVLMNKYAEGQSGKRYYQGNTNIDKIEDLCKQRALKLFKLNSNDWHVNVQCVTGSVANLAIYNSILKPGEKLMGMYLPHGGHLSHGWKLDDGKSVSFTSAVYDTDFYYISKDTNKFNYEEVEKRVSNFKPKLLISGGTAYPRTIDHKRLSEIAHKVGALYLADVAHEAGLIAGGVHPSPFSFADFVMMTTRKTLRGPIGSIIFCRKKYADQLDRAVFPGLQGGPMINSIAGISIALDEASLPEFKKYAQQVVKNAKELAKNLIKDGFNVITGGTDKHLILVDVRPIQSDGHIAALILEGADIVVNKNTIPFDEKGTAWKPSGIRIGTPAITTRGMKEPEMKIISGFIKKLLTKVKIDPTLKTEQVKKTVARNETVLQVKMEVHNLTKKFPIYSDLKQ